MAGYTLLLDDNWDVTLDGSGNIAVTQGAYGIAQNVANAVRLFTNDACFDQTRGIPHFDIELGRVPSLSVLRARIRQAALDVDGVAEAEVSFLSFEGRVLTGEVQITTTTGEAASVAV